MLKPPAFSRKKNPKKEDLLEEGMTLLRGNLHKQATKVFQSAIQENTAAVSQRLFDEFNSAFKNARFEAAVAIGNALLEVIGKNSEFLVKLGNCYRRLYEYQAANDLYRKALRFDKSNKLALYNLGASLAQVDKFDLEIKKTLDPFKQIDQAVLPPYLNDPEIVDKITFELEKERKERTSIIESLKSEKKREQKAGNTERVKELVGKVEHEERQLAIPTYQAICKKLRKANKSNWARQTIEESKTILQENLFNLGLYALSQKDLALAKDSFIKLKAENSSIANLDLLLAVTLDQSGLTNQAIEKLITVLKTRPVDRYATVNLGLLYKKRGNLLLSIRYLIKAADLLEKSGGLYSLAEIETRATEFFENEEFGKAFDLFKIVTQEAPSANNWVRIGEIHILREELVEATMALHEALEIDSRHAKAKQKLLQIHDIYSMKADTQFRNGLYPEAITFYQNALEIHRSLEVMTKAIRAYEKLNDFSHVNFLKSEIERLKHSENEEQLEQKRLVLVEKGKLLMKQKKLDKAIELLEKAFDIKPDKDTFLLLAHIFKALNHSRKLASLVQQWRILMEREVKIRESQE